MRLVRIPNQKTEQDIVYGAKRGSSGEIILMIVLGLLILAAIFMGERRGHLDENFLLIVLTLMVAVVVVRWISHLIGR